MSCTSSTLRPGRPVTWVWTGELDLADTPGLKTTWRSILERDPRRITIDMAAVTFVDCAVVSFLLGARRHAGSRLVLRHVPAVAVDLFRWTALTDVLFPPSQQPPPAAPPSAAAAARCRHAA